MNSLNKQQHKTIQLMFAKIFCYHFMLLNNIVFVFLNNLSNYVFVHCLCRNYFFDIHYYVEKVGTYMNAGNSQVIKFSAKLFYFWEQG